MMVGGGVCDFVLHPALELLFWSQNKAFNAAIIWENTVVIMGMVFSTYIHVKLQWLQHGDFILHQPHTRRAKKSHLESGVWGVQTTNPAKNLGHTHRNLLTNNINNIII